MFAQEFGKRLLWAVSTAFGTWGMLCLLASFSEPPFGLEAFLCA
jgi:hypothetical protein